MKVKSTQALRYFIKTQKGGDFDRRTDSDFIGSYHGSPAKGIKGFFKIFHGIKENIPGYLQPILKIAEDGQAVYEFIQNAVDCDSTQFWIFYNDEYFLAINNGDPFKQNEIASILNIAQSDKRNLNDNERCGKIGRFGIGFKLVHRLVGENDGSTELTNIENGMLKGPVLFSWSHYSQLNSLINSSDSFEQVEFNKDDPEDYHKSPWLFKILLTNFPTSPGELVKDFSYNPFTPLPISEVNEFKNYLRLCLGETLSNKALLSKGSIFFIKLGRGKAERLRKEALQLENGVNYSMHFFNKLQKITINESIITKKSMEWLSYEIKRNDDEFIDINPEYLFCPIKISIGFAKEDNKIKSIKSQPNFYKYFPLGDETNKLGLIVHSDAFDIESNRRKLHNSSRNERLINAITNRVIETLNLLIKNNDEKYKYLFLSILLSESSQTESNENTLNFINPLKAFIKNKVVTNGGNTQSENVKIKAFKFPIELKDIGFENHQWFAWNDISFKEACDSANSELGIEKWGLRHLLSNSEGQNISTYLKSIKQDEYIKFIEELKSEDLIKSLKQKLLEVSWLFTKGGKFVSVQKVIDGEVFLIKDISKEGASVFQKISKDIICPELNFAYGYIIDIAGPIETSTITICDFLCQPETVLLINSFTFEERTYLNGLVNKAEEPITFLPLFKSKKQCGSLKPLNSLISNTCEDLPTWLNDIVIDADEEKALGTTFQAQLLKEKDLLEKLFCNSETYSEIITGINIDNVEEFYEYLLKLHAGKAEDFDIDKTIQWVFIESSLSFSKASDVYLPDSTTKLPKNKYDSVKAVIESISDEKLPHFSALQIKAPFALGGNNFQLAAITPKQNSFDVIPVNDFLDWAESNGEKDLLQNLTFSKVDEKITIGKAIETVAYYTTDLDLIKLIEASIFKAKFTLFPSELHTDERSKIGLLEEASLLKYLLDEGYANIDLAKYIQSSNDPNLSLKFLENLVELNITTSKTYISEDDEFRILKLAIQYIVPDKDKLKSFKNKITIDGQPLLERAISEDVYFYDKNVGLKTKLSDILPAYMNRTFPLTEIIEKFEGFEDNKNLVAILKDEGRTPKKIFKELNELQPVYYSPKQTFFLSYYKTQYPNEEVFEDKVLFSNTNSQNKLQFTKEIHEFLDVCLKENSYIDFVIQDIIPNFKPTNLIVNEKYAIESEKIPHWLREWLDKSNTQEKLTYLAALKINCDIFPIVVYRQAILDSNQDYINSFRESITNNVLLINTLVWLSKQKEISNLLLNKELLQPLYKKLLYRNIEIDNLLFPCLEACGLDSYSLQKINESDEFHLMNEGWGEYKQNIFANLISSRKITDDVLPKSYRDFLQVIDKTFVKLPDGVNLEADSYPLDLEYYQEWDLKVKYNIRIYKGAQLPYLIKYNDILITKVSDGFAACIEGVFYLVESAKDNLFAFLVHVPEFDALQALRAQKQLFDESQESEKWKVKFTEQELEALKRLFGDEIPTSFYKDLNVAALVTGLIYLNDKGFDVTEAELNLKESHKKAQLYPIYNREKTKSFTVMGRSAKSGLLYITARAWNRLEDDNTWLFVTSGKNEIDQHLFKNKQEILDISITDFQVFRVEAESKQENIDNILNGKFDLGSIWLILKMKENEKYKSIFEGGIRRNEANPDYDNINTSENSPY